MDISLLLPIIVLLMFIPLFLSSRKQKRAQHLPLSAPAMVLLADWRAASAAGEPHLFPGDVPGKSLQDIKNFWRGVTKAAALPGYRLHDNRHTHA